MNRQTKRYRKLGLARKVVKGASDGIHGKSSLCNDVSVEIFSGKFCHTDFRDRDKNPQNKRKSAHKYKSTSAVGFTFGKSKDPFETFRSFIKTLKTL